MIRKAAIHFVVLLLLMKVSQVAAQETDYNNYQPLKCEGKAPEDFTKPSYKKFYSEAADIKKAKNLSKREKKLQKEFSLITNFKIDDMLMSGKVLYGNKVCDYINDVADRLLESRPDLQGKMRFYLLNVSYANAISTNNGIIFVTTGLMARLQNEAQLAFVLSHEISHYTLHHSFETFKNTQDVLVSKRYDNLGTEDKVLRILKYSKNNESEADIEGLRLFSKAGYDQREAVKMMDILLYSYLPFDDIVFPKTFFDDEYYEVPKVFFRDTASSITANEDEDDEESSHPNTGFRKLKLEKFIKGDTSGIIYRFSELRFHDIVKTCRYELGYLLVTRGQYTKAFYNAYLLSVLYGESSYTVELMSACLYGITKNKLSAEYDDFSELFNDLKKKEFEGQIAVVSDFFDFLKNDEFNVLAAKWIYKNAIRYPSKYHQKLVLDIFTDLFYAHEYDGGTFNIDFVSRDNTNLNADDFDADDVEDDEDSGTKKKSKKKKKKNSKKQYTGKSDYYKNAFVEEFKDDAFSSFFEAVQKKAAKIKSDEENMGLEELRSEPARRYRQWILDEIDIQKRKGKRLGIDSIILLAPSYKAFYLNKEQTESKTDDLSDELKSIEITEMLKDIAGKTHLTYNLIDVNSRSTLNDSQLNRFAMVNNWMTEKFNHVDKNDILFSQRYMDDMVATDGFRYAAATGLTYTSTKHIADGPTIFASLVTVFPIPFLVGHIFDSKKELNFYYLVYDLQTGEEKLLSFTRLRRKPKTKVLKMQLAYVFYQTKAKGKRKK
ncbi:MAG: M48 family metallopeptidase [Bacteroidota bacterium]